MAEAKFAKVNSKNYGRQFKYSFTANIARGVFYAGGAGVVLAAGFLKLVAPLHFQLIIDKCLGRNPTKHD
jgi:hypothetical protein